MRRTRRRRIQRRDQHGIHEISRAVRRTARRRQHRGKNKGKSNPNFHDGLLKREGNANRRAPRCDPEITPEVISKVKRWNNIKCRGQFVKHCRAMRAPKNNRGSPLCSAAMQPERKQRQKNAARSYANGAAHFFRTGLREQPFRIDRKVRREFLRHRCACKIAIRCYVKSMTALLFRRSAVGFLENRYISAKRFETDQVKNVLLLS